MPNIFTFCFNQTGKHSRKAKLYSISFVFDAWAWPYRDRTSVFLTVQRPWPFLSVFDRFMIVPETVPSRSRKKHWSLTWHTLLLKVPNFSWIKSKIKDDVFSQICILKIFSKTFKKLFFQMQMLKTFRRQIIVKHI